MPGSGPLHCIIVNLRRLTMCRESKRKCLHCRDGFQPDHRNQKRQRYCFKPDCRKASKTASQRRWLGKPENQDYFKGADHVRRVQAWRNANPGYRRKKEALQDSCSTQLTVNADKNSNKNTPEQQNRSLLQDPLIMQHPLLIGLLANLTGHVLQDDIARSASRFVKLGLDILSGQPNLRGGQHDYQTNHSP